MLMEKSCNYAKNAVPLFLYNMISLLSQKLFPKRRYEAEALTFGATRDCAIHKALLELREMGWIEGKLPRLVAVQSSACAPTCC
jgi:hypothetical protein